METKLQIHNVDQIIDLKENGNVVDKSAIEKITGENLAKPDDFQKMAMSLKYHIERKHEELTIRVFNDKIQILEGYDSSIYNRRKVLAAIGNIRQKRIKLQNINTSDMTEDQKKEHIKWINFTSRIEQSNATELKKFIPIPIK